jgi:hypothetical protein
MWSAIVRSSKGRNILNVDVYLLSVPPDEHNQLVRTLAHNLGREQLPFVFKNRFDSVSCQVVLYEEQLMMLKLAVPTLKATRLIIDDAETDIPLDSSEGGRL